MIFNIKNLLNGDMVEANIPNQEFELVDAGNYSIYRDPTTGAMYLQIQEDNYRYANDYRLTAEITGEVTNA